MIRRKAFAASAKINDWLDRAIKKWPKWLKAGCVFLLDVIAVEMDREHNPFLKYLLFGIGILIALGAFDRERNT